MRHVTVFIGPTGARMESSDDGQHPQVAEVAAAVKSMLKHGERIFPAASHGAAVVRTVAALLPWAALAAFAWTVRQWALILLATVVAWLVWRQRGSFAQAADLWLRRRAPLEWLDMQSRAELNMVRANRRANIRVGLITGLPSAVVGALLGALLTAWLKG